MGAVSACGWWRSSVVALDSYPPAPCQRVVPRDVPRPIGDTGSVGGAARAPPQRLADAEDAVAGKQRERHQHQAEAELPGGRIDLREEVREQHVGDGADEGAVEPPV